MLRTKKDIRHRGSDPCLTCRAAFCWAAMCCCSALSLNSFRLGLDSEMLQDERRKLDLVFVSERGWNFIPENSSYALWRCTAPPYLAPGVFMV